MTPMAAVLALPRAALPHGDSFQLWPKSEQLFPARAGSGCSGYPKYGGDTRNPGGWFRWAVWAGWKQPDV